MSSSLKERVVEKFLGAAHWLHKFLEDHGFDTVGGKVVGLFLLQMLVLCVIGFVVALSMVIAGLVIVAPELVIVVLCMIVVAVGIAVIRY